MSPKLESLFKYLDSLQGPAPISELQARVARLDLTSEDLAEFIHFSPQGYTHNSVRGGRWYHAWVLCWQNGQRSPIHDHQGSACCVRVLRGTLTETRFVFAPNGHVKAEGSTDYAPGSILGSRDMDLHQVSNLQADDAALVTLHIYSPPLFKMGTYSLSDRSRGEEVWSVEQRKVVTSFPENSETPVQNLQSWVTPNRLFFVRNHFEMPVLDIKDWRLRIEGLVKQPREWTFEELTEMPQRSVFATVECAGNGRSFLHKKQPGVQWGAGAIGHAEWTGVPLCRVLEQSGIKPGSTEVIFEGADQGSEADHPQKMHFARSLKLKKALDPDTILVYRMNGELLTPSHGYPLRLFVPGWYGVASVKWLQRIEVTDKPFQGYFQTVKYTFQRRGRSGVETEIVGPMGVKSEIIRPQSEAVLGLGSNRLFGVAWAGEEAVAQVEVSTDGGQTWNPAQLIGQRAPYSWTLWEYIWEVATPDDYTLLSRAVSESGRVQPTQHDPLWAGYMIHHSRPTRVTVQLMRPRDTDLLVYDMNAYAEANARLPLDVEMDFVGGEGI